jgi:glucosamine--fructose-6-phosphate aminotransferase (isomerizing)
MSDQPALHTMIAQQGDVLARLADGHAGPEIAAAAERLRGAGRVDVVGTGTSQHAAELGALALAGAGVDARALASSQAARSAPAPDPPNALIVISHTGETAYARAVRRRALEAGAALVTITGPTAEWQEAIQTPVRESSETYTVSYTAALAVLCLLAHHLGAPDSGPQQLHAVAARVGALAGQPEIDHVPLPARALAIVGPGPWNVTAREGALKIREGARMLAEGFDSERLLHGFAVPYTAADALLALQPGADPDGLTAGVRDAAAAEGIPVATVEETDPPSNAVLAQIPVTVRLQMLAARFARQRRTNPDTAITGAWSDEGLWSLGAP